MFLLFRLKLIIFNLSLIAYDNYVALHDVNIKTWCSMFVLYKFVYIFIFKDLALFNTPATPMLFENVIDI